MKSPISLVPRWNDDVQPFRKTWQGVGNIDQFRWLSRGDVWEHLKRAREELGLKYVRAAAMYSPEMRVLEFPLRDWRTPADSKGRVPNWQMVDLTLEALLELGLKPIYTTCFMPSGLSDDPASCWPDKNGVGMPRDLAEWEDFVAQGVRHHVERFGLEEVRSWLFECWNEPNLNGFFNGTQKDFFQLWDATWRAVKSVDEELKIGGPSTARGEWVVEFLDHARAAGTPPDFIITHIYNNDSESEPLSPFDGPASYRVKESPHFASGVIRGLKKELQAREWRGEVHWNEWGRSWFPTDPLRETALEAAFIVKTMAECSQCADAFAFWCLSDIYDQAGFQGSEFEGHYGMLSLHGLRKPAWMAHQLLGELRAGSVSVTGGDEWTGALATRDDQGASLLVFAYPEKPGKGVESIQLQAHWPFEQAALVRLGLDENNIISEWKRMGAPPYPTRTQMDQLKASNDLRAAPPSELRRISESTISFEMERPGVALLRTVNRA